MWMWMCVWMLGFDSQLVILLASHAHEKTLMLLLPELAAVLILVSLTRVSAEVALKLVGPGEALAAEEPVADERPFARVPSKVGLQMARLAVHLAAARYVATVDVLLAQVSACRS